MSNIVAIVGRPNVGKSTLFNRLIERRDAIVDEVSGVTRDRNYGKSDWNGKEFSVIDTGGYIRGSEDVFEAEIRKQVLLAIEEANAILFVVDGKAGLLDLDKEVAKVLRKTSKPIFLLVNKIDNPGLMENQYEFHELGFERLYTSSALNGSGTGDFLDELVKVLPEDDSEIDESHLPRITIVGRPNVGKSTLTNALMGEEKNIVTDVAGTTRDSLEVKYNKFGLEFYLVDTAGIRRKSKVHEDLEFYSVMRSIRSIEHADVCLLMLDATRGWESQDMNIFHICQKNNKGIVILVNKWDTVEDKETNTVKEFEAKIRQEIQPFDDVPIMFISALTKQRIFKALEKAQEIFENRTRKIKTSKLNEVMLPIIEFRPPPANKGKYIKIKFCTQLPTHSPKFAFFANLPQYIKEPYRRFVENQLRKNFNFEGVPIEVYFRKK